MTTVHEKLDVGNQPEPLSEARLISRFALLHTDILRFKKLRELKLLTEEHQHQWRQTSAELSDLAAATLPRITSGELESIGLDYVPGDRVVLITLFEGKHKVPVAINPQLREMLSGK